MSEDYFGERVAERYDESAADMFEPAVSIPLSTSLPIWPVDGAALELGIGTGRIALPLTKRGVRVHGIDLSTAMVARLRAKPGAERIGVTVGDFATTTVEATFSLAYLVFNTIMNLTTEDEQIACFQNVAAHLDPGGCFVIEVGVPALQRLPPGESVRAFNVGATSLGFDEYDVVSQGLVSHHYSVVDGKLEIVSIPFRYVWPSELDLMARLAGMTLRERWSGWNRAPFTSGSTKHVSVWEKPASASQSHEFVSAHQGYLRRPLPSARKGNGESSRRRAGRDSPEARTPGRSQSWQTNREPPLGLTCAPSPRRSPAGRHRCVESTRPAARPPAAAPMRKSKVSRVSRAWAMCPDPSQAAACAVA